MLRRSGSSGRRTHSLRARTPPVVHGPRWWGCAGTCNDPPMRKLLPAVLGGLMVVVGAVWTFQGLGYLEGSPMTGVDFWAIIGPIVAGLGVALAYVGLRGPR